MIFSARLETVCRVQTGHLEKDYTFIKRLIRLVVITLLHHHWAGIDSSLKTIAKGQTDVLSCVAGEPEEDNRFRMRSMCDSFQVSMKVAIWLR